jgi:hypothetical protein
MDGMRGLGLLVIVAGCADIGPIPHTATTFLAVGASASISSQDDCVGEHRTELITYYCFDDTVTAISGTIEPPFTFGAQGTSGIVTAHDVGDETLQLTVHTASDRDRIFPVPFRGRHIDGVTVVPTCDRPPAAGPLLLATSTTIGIEWTATSGDTPLGTSGLPAPLVGEALTLDAPGPRFAKVTTAAMSGLARLVSPDVPGFSFEVEVVDRANVQIEWRAQPSFASVSSTVNVFVTAKAAARELCVMPGGGWTMEALTPTTCKVVGTTSFADGARVAFVVYAIAAGACQVNIHEPTGMLDRVFEMAISP